MILEQMAPSIHTEADVSSQEDSIASMCGMLAFANFAKADEKAFINSI
jgi:hypothetical protein